jgi:4-hydroxybenzoate polyprenyltransferase
MTLRGWIYREFVLGGHLLALGTASIAAAVATVLSEPVQPLLLVMAYLFSYGAYSMNRGAEFDQDDVSHPERTSLLAGRRKYLPVITGAYFVLGYALAATVNYVFFVALLVPLALSVLYSVGSKRLTGVLGVSKLKEKLLVKNLVVSLGWSLIPVLVGLYYLHLGAVLAVFSVLIFLRLLTNTLLFDVRDVEGDRAAGITTVPVAAGAARTFVAMGLVDAAAAAYLVLAVIGLWLPAFTLVYLALPVYSLAYAYLARRPGANMGLICDLMADGEFILWGPLMVIGKALS